MSNKDGIIMANGVVLKDGLNSFKADKKLVSNSLLHIAKISKGLYSGVLNSDSDFMKFQEESMNGLVEKETIKLCSKVVVGAEKMLSKISCTMVAEKAVADKYIYDRHTTKEVEPIIITGDKSVENNSKKTETEKVCDLIKERGDELASLNEEEVGYLKAVNKESKKVTDLRNKIRKNIIQGKIKKKLTNKKKAKKKNVRRKKDE